MPTTGPQIAVIGGASCGRSTADIAFRIGREIARAGATLLCGGRGGVMLASAEGAASAGGAPVGILPGANALESPPNRHIRTAIYTGMGQARNQVLVLSADAVIGCGGGWGTLTEIGLALKHGRPVVLVESWNLEVPPECAPAPLYRADTAEAAVRRALDEIEAGRDP